MEESDLFWEDFEISDSDNITITQLERLPTQDFVITSIPAETSKRFENVRPSSSKELEDRKRDRMPKNTRRQNSWAMGAYEDWARWRNSQTETIFEECGMVPINLESESKEIINFWMARFVVECRRKGGSPYPPNSLYNLVTGIQRMLREQGRNDINFLELTDVSFAEFRKQLDGRMKELTNQGVGIHRQRADPITDDDETRLWDTGVIGTKSAKALSNGVFFYNCKIFGFRGGDEHRSLHTSQYMISEENGEKVLTFYGRNSKNVQGGLKQRKVEPKVVKQFADPANDRCVVNLFEQYFSHIPSGDFYLRPLPGKPGRPIMFSSQKVGSNFLGKYMRTMFEEAGITTDNRNIRNHSGKVTLCTKLYENSFDEQAIMLRSGHRSVAVRDYKRPSIDLQRNLSRALQPQPSTASETPPPPRDEAISSTLPAVKSEPDIQDNQTIELTVPDYINTVVVIKNGRKISVTL